MSDKLSDIELLPPLREVIRTHDLHARKKFGQNFLLDLNITDKIARRAAVKDRNVIEIGPGPGGLTRSLLLAGADHLTVFEVDENVLPALQEIKRLAGSKLTIHCRNALNVEYDEFPTGSIIVANLPYNVATPLLIKWLRIIHTSPQAISSLTLMFQREVADRILAEPGDKDYGRLSVLAGWLCRGRKEFDLPPGAFWPPPKVTSSVVHLVPHDLAETGKPAFETVEALTARAFGKRRKMLRASLKDYRSLMTELEIDETLRPEQLSRVDFLRLANKLDQAD
mgnify:CR=1 FL=1